MDIFNYLSERVTIRYIGVNQKEIEKAMIRFKILSLLFFMVLPSNIYLIKESIASG